MTELIQFAAFVGAVAIVAGVIICALCAVKALQFYAEECRRARRADDVGGEPAGITWSWSTTTAPLSPHVPLEPMRPLESRPVTELDRRRALREERDPERPGC